MAADSRITASDDLGNEVTIAHPALRIVSLVPSLTEAVATIARERLVGATRWCTHPADLEVTRVRGTKNPDVEAIVRLAPDVVVANFEENRDSDLDALRAAGIAVWTTAIRTLPEALTSLERMVAALGLPSPPWLAAARAAWADVLDALPAPRVRAVVPIWRRPWMVLGRDTFAGDVLARLGVANVYADAGERYPRAGLDEIRASGAELVVLPDEPYAFGPDDGPECFPGLPCSLVSGRYLTWYGPSLVEAREALGRALANT